MARVRIRFVGTLWTMGAQTLSTPGAAVRSQRGLALLRVKFRGAPSERNNQLDKLALRPRHDLARVHGDAFRNCRPCGHNTSFRRPVAAPREEVEFPSPTGRRSRRAMPARRVSTSGRCGKAVSQTNVTTERRGPLEAVKDREFENRSRKNGLNAGRWRDLEALGGESVTAG